MSMQKNSSKCWYKFACHEMSKKGFRKGFLCVLLAGMMNSTMAESKFRTDYYEPNVMQREGLAFLRIIGSPCALFTEGAQWYNENNAAGDQNPLAFIAGMCWFGVPVMCMEIIGGTCELVTFQQFKSCAYPWEINDNNERTVEMLRSYAEERAQEAGNVQQEYGAVSYSQCSGQKTVRQVQVQPTRKEKPRIKHSSCHGTGTCNICKGKGFVGANMKCTGCGGTGICRACRGSGYAN